MDGDIDRMVMVRPVECELPRMTSCEHLHSYARSRSAYLVLDVEETGGGHGGRAGLGGLACGGD